jgi:hypothetical protein
MLTALSAMEMARNRDSRDEFDAENQFCYQDGDEDDDVAPLEIPEVESDSFAPGPVRVQMPTISTSSPRESRKCTAAELEEKRRNWERMRAERREREERESAAMKAMFGGIDPSDPKTMDEFARRLQGQGGWRRIVHKGSGVFEVDYQVSGRLDHDFVFPVFDGVDAIIPFVQAVQRGGGKIRVTAPAFVKPGGGDRMGMSAFGAAAMMGEGGRNPWPFKSPEGSFTLTTDGEFLTNNTRDGPTVQGASKSLRWTITPLDTAKPEALIQL